MGVEVGGCGSTSIKVMGIIFASEYACTIKRDWGGGTIIGVVRTYIHIIYHVTSYVLTDR